MIMTLAGVLAASSASAFSLGETTAAMATQARSRSRGSGALPAPSAP